MAGTKLKHRVEDRSGKWLIARNGSYLLAANTVARGLRIVYLAALARVLGPELFGVLSLAYFWVLVFLPLAAFGTNRLLAHQIGAEPEKAATHLSDLLGLRIIGIVLSLLISISLSLLWSLDPLTLWLVSLFNLNMIWRSLATWITHSLVATHRGEWVFRLELVFRSLEVILGLCVLALGGGIVAIALVHLCSWGLQALAGWVLLQRLHGTIRPRWKTARFALLARAGFAFMLIGFSTSVLEQGGILSLRAQGIDDLQIGQVAILLQILLVFLMAPKAFAVAALPVFSAQARQSDKEQSTPALLRGVLVSGAAIALSGAALGPILLPLVLGESYRQAIEQLGSALWLLLPISAATVLNQLTSAHGQVKVAAANTVLGATLAMLFLWLPTGLDPIENLLTGMAAGACLWALLDLLHATRAGWIDPAQTLMRPAVSICAAVGVFQLAGQAYPWLALLMALACLPAGLAPIVRWRAWFQTSGRRFRKRFKSST